MTTPPAGRQQGTLSDALRLSVGTLTAVPVAPPRRVDRQVAGLAMALAPLAALPLAVPVVLVLLLGRAAHAPAGVVAVLVVAGLVLGTRAMHLDGLADTADGLSASYDRERALEVMRRSDIGPSGVAAVALVLLLQVAALTALAGSVAGAVAAGVAVLLGRHGLAWACAAGVPSARPSGLGATVAGSIPRRGVAVCAAGALVLAWVAVALAGAAGWLGPAMWAGGVVAAAAVLRRCTTRLGGVTGDVLGAVVELGTAASLTVAAVLLPHAG